MMWKMLVMNLKSKVKQVKKTKPSVQMKLMWQSTIENEDELRKYLAVSTV